MAERTMIDTGQGRRLEAYISLARGDSAAGLVVVSDQPGLPRWTSDLCDRLADHGFSAAAPDLDTDWLLGDGTADDHWAVDLARCRAHLTTRMDAGSAQIGLLGFGTGGRVVLHVAGQHGDAWSAVAAVACPAEPLAQLYPPDTPVPQEPSCPARLFYGANEPPNTIETARRFASRARQAGNEVAVVVDHDHPGTNLGPPGWNRLIAFLDLTLTFDSTVRSSQ